MPITRKHGLRDNLKSQREEVEDSPEEVEEVEDPEVEEEEETKAEAEEEADQPTRIEGTPW